MADIIALCVEQVVDVIATSGRCNSHMGGRFYFNLSSSGVKQNLIQYVRQMVFAYVFL